jgi:bifunctional non-homologous end joining protein LigD
MESITLYYREGSSDKVYQASIQPQGGGHMVHFAYGRRGSTLTTGTKTTSPVDYPQAKTIFDKLVRLIAEPRHVPVGILPADFMEST